MLFFVSMMDAGQVAAFRDRMVGHFAKQDQGFRRRFGPAVAGLHAVLDGDGSDPAGRHASSDGRRFPGWSVGGHWLLDQGAAPTREHA